MNKLLFLLLLPLALGCHTAKKIASDAPRERSAKFLVKKMVQNQVNARYFSARTKMNLDYDGQQIAFTGNLRWVRDSAIWVNAKKFNIEAGRALITPDSFHLLDRINQQFISRQFSYLQEAFDLPANFDVLQNLLLGNPVFFTQDLNVTIDGAQYVLKGETDRFLTTYYLDGDQYTLNRYEMVDKSTSESLEMIFSNHQALDQEQKFSYLRYLTVNSKDYGELRLELEFAKVELNTPKELPFEIPDRYTEIKNP